MEPIKLVTFNVRNRVWEDGVNSLAHRLGLIMDIIDRERPDAVAFQEIQEFHLQALRRVMPEYAFFGQLRNENYDGEGLYTAVRTDAFDLLGLETVWLSPTPYEPGSRYADQSKCPRICVMTQLRHRESGTCLRLFNVHLDHVSESARRLGMESVLAFVRSYEEKRPMPHLILGDFNAVPDSDAVRLCRQAGERISNAVPASSPLFRTTFEMLSGFSSTSL